MTTAPRRSGFDIGWLGLAALGMLLVALILLVRSAERIAGALGGGRTTLSHAVALGRLESAAKLVTTEAGLRDVVVYQNSRLGSTKRSLVVVSGTALVGIDLQDRATVDIDEEARRITLSIPRARLIGVDISELKTYDEARGLWNWFRPADRDTIYLLARAQLMHAANDLAIIEHAEQSARSVLTALFATDGYSVDVVFQPFLARPAPR